MVPGGAHILLVEDEPHVLHILGHRLEAEGYRLTACSNGRDALDASHRDRPDLIITDVRMPGMSGLELAAALGSGEETATIPLIVLTAHAINSEALQGTNVRELRSKPFSARAIVRLVGAILAEQH